MCLCWNITASSVSLPTPLSSKAPSPSATPSSPKIPKVVENVLYKKSRRGAILPKPSLQTRRVEISLKVADSAPSEGATPSTPVSTSLSTAIPLHFEVRREPRPPPSKKPPTPTVIPPPISPSSNSRAFMSSPTAEVYITPTAATSSLMVNCSEDSTITRDPPSRVMRSPTSIALSPTNKIASSESPAAPRDPLPHEVPSAAVSTAPFIRQVEDIFVPSVLHKRHLLRPTHVVLSLIAYLEEREKDKSFSFSDPSLLKRAVGQYILATPTLNILDYRPLFTHALQYAEFQYLSSQRPRYNNDVKACAVIFIEALKHLPATTLIHFTPAMAYNWIVDQFIQQKTPPKDRLEIYSCVKNYLANVQYSKDLSDIEKLIMKDLNVAVREPFIPLPDAGENYDWSDTAKASEWVDSRLIAHGIPIKYKAHILEKILSYIQDFLAQKAAIKGRTAPVDKAKLLAQIFNKPR